MPWDSAAHNGFSTASPWIVSADRGVSETVEAQVADPNAIVHRYRELLAVRKANPDLFTADFERLTTGSPTVGAVRRGTMLVIANFSPESSTVSAAGDEWEPLYISRDAAIGTGGGAIVIPAETSVILRQIG
jgi:glycosidase